jgi:ComF family protein
MVSNLSSRSGLLRAVAGPFLDVLYPSVCFVCGLHLESGSSRVCSSCWREAAVLERDTPLYSEMHRRLTEGGNVQGLVSLFRFEKEGVLQSIIHQLKYEGATSLGIELGRRLGGRIREVLGEAGAGGVLPVPLHRTKLRERGYNQSEYVCKGIRMETGLPVFRSLLRRRKYTESQTTMGIAERRENVGDAFEVAPHVDLPFADRSLLLVDDVITTGATIESCAKVLAANGLRNVIACSVALADHTSLP